MRKHIDDIRNVTGSSICFEHAQLDLYSPFDVNAPMANNIYT